VRFFSGEITNSQIVLTDIPALARLTIAGHGSAVPLQLAYKIKLDTSAGFRSLQDKKSAPDKWRL
jgi:hypothetical protein